VAGAAGGAGLDADMTAVLQRVAKERQDTGRKISITHAC